MTKNILAICKTLSSAHGQKWVPYGFMSSILIVLMGSSINDVTPEGEGGGIPQKVTRGDKGEVPCFNQR